MACGTPVIARPMGAVREVVVPGQTGLFGDDVDELAAAVRRIAMISRTACRRHVETRFSVERMAADYESVYARLVPSTKAA